MFSKVFSDQQSAKLSICDPRSRMQEDGHSVGQVSETRKALTKWHKIIRAREDLDFLSFLEAKTSFNSFPCLVANGLVIPRIGRILEGLMDSEFPAFSSNTFTFTFTMINMLDLFDMDDMEDMGL